MYTCAYYAVVQHETIINNELGTYDNRKGDLEAIRKEKKMSYLAGEGQKKETHNIVFYFVITVDLRYRPLNSVGYSISL
jgi:hypothetical protein